MSDTNQPASIVREHRRPAFEQAVIDRMKEGGFLEVEIRVECLGRNGDSYDDGSVDAYWHFWNAAIDHSMESTHAHSAE